MTKILFCEDDILLQKMIGIALRNLPYTLLFATDGLTALALSEQELPDLIFTDQQVDGLNGLQLCAELKARVDLAHVPVILMSGETWDDKKCAQFSFASYLTKPFRIGALYAKIDEFLTT